MRLLVRALMLAIIVCVVLFAQDPPPNRIQCCHGCKSYSCSDKECGTTCKSGPKCNDCWKDCK